MVEYKTCQRCLRPAEYNRALNGLFCASCERIWNLAPARPTAMLAGMVLERGKPFHARVACEGDVESGPYALDYYGFRWGQLRVVLEPRGTVHITWPLGWKETPYGWDNMVAFEVVRDAWVRQQLDLSRSQHEFARMKANVHA